MKLHSILASVLLLTACAQSASTGVSISQVYIGAQLNDRGEIEVVQTEFPVDQNAIFAHAIVTGHTDATLVTGEWWYDGGDAPRKIYQASVTVIPDRPVAMFTLQSTQNWVPGEYRFVMMLEDEQLSETKFSVVE